MQTVNKILRDLGATAKLDVLSRVVHDWVKDTPDGLPIPSAKLRYLISGDPDYSVASYFAMGKHCAQRIAQSLKKAGAEIESFGAILDFGCGCGRTIRHFRSLKKVELYGTDYNPKLVDWCRRSLTFARFSVNQLHPPLGYPAETFDLVYAFSVFTHLPEPLQFSWMKDLSRVLRPAGFLVISTLPMGMLAEDQRTNELVVCDEGKAGSNTCLAYHTPAYVKEKLATGFEVIEFIESQGGQDFYLLRKLTN